MNLLVLLLIVGGTLALVAIPLAPSIRAWRRGVDDSALEIRDRYDSEAHRTAADVDDRVRRNEFEQVERVDGDFRLEANQRLDATVSVSGCFEAEEGSSVCAVHAGDEVRLGANVTAKGWLHAGRRARLDSRASVVGSLSAGEELSVAVGAHFERLSARTLQFGRDADPVSEDAAFLVQEPTPVPEDVRWIAWSKAIYDDYEIPGRTWMHGDLIVRGDLTVGAGAVIDGTVKVHGSVDIGDDVRITGGLFSDTDVHLGRACRIDGVCTAGGALDIDSDTVIGHPDRRVTVTAARLTVSDGVRVHGVVVATERGTVKAGESQIATGNPEIV